jgi:hypothetical protein
MRDRIGSPSLVTIRATAPDGTNVESPAAGIALPLSLAAPGDLSVRTVGSQIVATWSPVTSATLYDARLLDANNNQLRLSSVAETNVSFPTSVVSGAFQTQRPRSIRPRFESSM